MANWRTAFKSDFLASWDLDGKIILTIEKVEVKEVVLKGKEKKVVAEFVEKKFPNNEIIKPMILNASNCKVLNSFTGTKETDEWKNIKVEIGVVENKGKIGEAHGLAILRVLSGEKFNKIESLKTLFEAKKQLVPQEHLQGLESVINDNIETSFDKAINYLKNLK